MEDQDRSSSVNSGWIVSSTYDLLFLANVGWLLLLLPGFASDSSSAVDFWQIYYLTLPHRWMTLILVATDPDRRDGRSRALIGVAVLVALVVVGLYLGTGTFLCLAMIDYVWNSWHFASQHAGVLRMYSRKVGGGWPGWERWGLRFFITYGALRAAGWATGMIEADPSRWIWLQRLDLVVLIIPLVLILSVVTTYTSARFGKLMYLASVCLLYSGFIVSLHFGWARGIVVFAAAGSMFHAVEYLAIVTHYAQRRRVIGSDGTMRTLARHWFAFFALYIVLLGSLGVWMSQPENGMFIVWQALNLWAAFVHYAYDGMIWKLRRPETAKALGVAT